MDKLQNTLISSLYKLRKTGVDLIYPVSNERLESIIVNLLDNYHFRCKTHPRIKATQLNKRGMLENTSTVVEMMLVHLDNKGNESSPTKINLYFDSFLNEENKPEFTVTGMFKNKFKEGIYRPQPIADEAGVREYVDTIFRELENKI